ncbi:MAG: hypothetical protein U5J64_01310 [Halobacteriales archaeon]|nr:hypothetical protein [Halobacteriales archaeon]
MENIDSDKAQVILIGGFLIAIGILGAVLIFNNIGFSQTIATQNGNSDDFGSIEFSDDAERVVAEAMKGNGSDPSGAGDHFDAYIESYSDGVNDVVSDKGVSAEVTPPSSTDITEAWMVGQRRTGDFNATGETEQWIMAETIGDNYKTEFELNVSDMKGEGVFTLNATESGSFPGTTGPLNGPGWTLTMEIDNNDRLTLRLTEIQSDGSEGGTDSVNNLDISGNDTLEVDVLKGEVEDNPGNFPSVAGVNTEDAEGFRFEDGGNGFGTYDFRFDGSFNTFSNSDGPCKHSSGDVCRSADGTEKHVVGVIHEVTAGAVDLSYVGRSTSYSKSVPSESMVLDAEDVNFEQIKNVDGAAYFDITDISYNGPVEEDGSNDIEVDFKVENTGNQDGTQNVTLRFRRETQETGRGIGQLPPVMIRHKLLAGRPVPTPTARTPRTSSPKTRRTRCRLASISPADRAYRPAPSESLCRLGDSTQ